jgi:hypothetical protein
MISQASTYGHHARRRGRRGCRAPLRLLVELAELDALNLAPEFRSQFDHLRSSQEAPRLGVIERRQSRIGVLEWLQGGKLVALVE